MAAVGLRGVVIDGDRDGFTLTAKADAMAVRMSGTWSRTTTGAPRTESVSR